MLRLLSRIKEMGGALLDLVFGHSDVRREWAGVPVLLGVVLAVWLLARLLGG
jgi:hypothetical protein